MAATKSAADTSNATTTPAITTAPTTANTTRTPSPILKNDETSEGTERIIPAVDTPEKQMAAPAEVSLPAAETPVQLLPRVSSGSLNSSKSKIPTPKTSLKFTTAEPVKPPSLYGAVDALVQRKGAEPAGPDSLSRTLSGRSFAPVPKTDLPYTTKEVVSPPPCILEYIEKQGLSSRRNSLNGAQSAPKVMESENYEPKNLNFAGEGAVENQDSSGVEADAGTSSVSQKSVDRQDSVNEVFRVVPSTKTSDINAIVSSNTTHSPNRGHSHGTTMMPVSSPKQAVGAKGTDSFHANQEESMNGDGSFHDVDDCTNQSTEENLGNKITEAFDIIQKGSLSFFTAIGEGFAGFGQGITDTTQTMVRNTHAG
jgi:hypothetical protein